MKLGNENVNLVFDMSAFAEIEEKVGLLSDLNEMISGRQRIRNAATLIAIMANHGDNEKKYTPDEVMKLMKPRDIATYLMSIMEAIGAGMTTETEENHGERDLVLEEISRKKDETC